MVSNAFGMKVNVLVVEGMAIVIFLDASNWTGI